MASDHCPPAGAEVQIWTTGTGGGHQSVAKALQQALLTASGGRLRVAIDDPLHGGGASLLRSLALGYGPLIRVAPAAWGALFRVSSRPWTQAALERLLVRQLAPAMSQLTQSRQPSLVVCCHPLLGPPAQRAASLASSKPQLVTMVTDLAGGHPGWLSARACRILTPSAMAASWCVAHGVDPSLVVDVGLPVEEEFARPAATSSQRRELRLRLGLDPNLLCLVLGGGGEGAGDLVNQVGAVCDSGLPVQVVVLCGRNRRLLRQLRHRSFRVPTTVLGFSTEVSSWLRAGDVYAGKAGPSSMAEAACAGLAVVITGALPGQEQANPRALVDAGAAIRAETPAGLVMALTGFCAPGGGTLGQLQAAAQRWARPGAGPAAAQELLSLLPTRSWPSDQPRSR